MIKESKKFPAVMTTQGILGIDEGTVLRFDWASGKYVSVVEEEDIADDYYYSGFAVAIDPYIVKDNIGICFTTIEQEKEPEPEPEPVKEEVKEPVKKVKKEKKEKKTKVEAKKEVVYSDEEAADQLKSEEEIIAEGRDPEAPESMNFPEYEKKHALIVDCDCGHRNLLQWVQAPGINITLMAEDESSFVELTCRECEASLKLWFAPENEVANEFTEKESN